MKLSMAVYINSAAIILLAYQGTASLSPVRVKRAPVNDIISLACTYLPEMSFCSKSLDGRNTAEENSIIEDDVIDTLFSEDNTNMTQNIETDEFEENNATTIVLNSDPVATTPSVVSEYCLNYIDHYAHFCEQNLENNSDQAHKFCTNYARSCGQIYDYERRLLSVYCSRYRDQYSQICSDALKYGLRAVEFCPTFAEVCGGAINTQPLIILKTAPPTVATPTTRPSFDLKAALKDKDPKQTETRTVGTGEWAPARVQATCAQYKSLYDQWCHTPVGKSGVGVVGNRCRLYETHCE